LLGYNRVLAKLFGGPAKVLEFFVSKRVGTLYRNLSCEQSKLIYAAVSVCHLKNLEKQDSPSAQGVRFGGCIPLRKYL